MRRLALCLCLGALALALPARADTTLRLTYLRQVVPPPPVLSNLDPIPADRGLAGARLGLEDNITTGRFLGQKYEMDETDVPPGGELLAAAKVALARSKLLLLDAPAADVLRVADLPEAKDALILDVATTDTGLRGADCRANVLHTMPSRAMRADALMQYLTVKRWTKLAMIAGPTRDDRAWADALKASAAKFRLTLVGEKNWDRADDLRRSASADVPLFTQSFPDHDVLLVADEEDDFARYISGNTWLPRPVAGSEGFVPATWTPAMEQWGAAQLQSRFEGLAHRRMTPRDYAAWAAVRTLGEALTRTGKPDAASLRAYILSPEFALGGFKGRPLSYRAWNGQLRQPIAVATPRALIAMAPFDAFLHQHDPLDTLGQDAPESACHAFGG